LDEVVGRSWQVDGDTAHAVVGVVKDVKGAYGFSLETLNAAFVPLGSEPGRQYSKLVVRTSGPPPNLEAVRALLLPTLGVVNVPASTVAAAAGRAVIERRFGAGLFLVIGMTGLLLLVAGLYATAAAEVAERRFETGLRLALGATAASVSRRVHALVLTPIAVGAAVGLTGAFWVAHAVDAYVYRVDTRDPWSYAIVVAALLAVTVAAAWPPARRAASSDPAEVLRAQ
jgi:ABC-type antimicrobial peptide transport system permease subunit